MLGCHKCTQLDTTAIPLKALFKAARRRIAILIWHTVNTPLVDHWGFYKISSKQGQAFEFVLAIIKNTQPFFCSLLMKFKMTMKNNVDL